MYELDNAVEKERKCDNEWKDSLEYFKTSKMTHFRRVRFKNVLFPVLFQRLIFNLHIHVVFFFNTNSVSFIQMAGLCTQPL